MTDLNEQALFDYVQRSPELRNKLLEALMAPQPGAVNQQADPGLTQIQDNLNAPYINARNYIQGILGTPLPPTQQVQRGFLDLYRK